MKTINITNKTISRWAELTDNNCHTLVKIEIAKYFGFDTYQKILELIDAEHDRIGYIASYLSQIRLIIGEAMMERIHDEYGHETYQKVSKGL